MTLIVLGAASGLMLMLLDGFRVYNYLIHVLPAYSVVLAIWFTDLIRRGGILRRATLAATVMFCLYSLATVAYRLRLNDYQRLYVPTMNFLNGNIQPGELVMAEGEFGVGLGWRKHCLDDPTLGYHNKLKPSYFVVSNYIDQRIAGFKQNRPEIYAHVRSTLDRSSLVYARSQGGKYYKVYRIPQDLPANP